jgi:hypothetical protein
MELCLLHQLLPAGYAVLQHSICCTHCIQTRLTQQLLLAYNVNAPSQYVCLRAAGAVCAAAALLCGAGTLSTCTPQQAHCSYGITCSSCFNIRLWQHHTQRGSSRASCSNSSWGRRQQQQRCSGCRLAAVCSTAASSDE